MGSNIGNVNWLLIVLCVVIVIVSSFFLFFWNRLLAWLLGFIIRTLLWKSNNAWIELDAIQFSLLAGRLMIKDIRYYSRNQSVRIVKLHITWRYWFWRSRAESDSSYIEIPGEGVEVKSKYLPCRLKVFAEGVEWFIYNRTPSYDDILQHMQDGMVEAMSQDFGRMATEFHDKETAGQEEDPIEVYTRTEKLVRFLKLPVGLVRLIISWIGRQLPSMELKDILPIGFELLNGAIVMGNDSMPTLFIASFKRATGSFGLRKCRSSLDPCKQVYNFRFANTKVYTGANRDFERSAREQGENVVNQIRKKGLIPKEVPASPENFVFKAFHAFTPLVIISALRQLQVPSSTKRWHGLARYTNQPTLSDVSEGHEYARLSTILETPILELTYYSDVAGKVPKNPRQMGNAGLESTDVGNGDLSPEWGIDFIVHGGQINYGPWTDRQRRVLQEAFAPATFYSKHPTEKLRPGQTRLHLALKVYLETRGPVTLRIPSREASKNWRYDAGGDLGPTRASSRPFGWLDISLGADSTVTYYMSMVAHEQGYDNMLQVHVDQLEVSSSVNQCRFIKANSCRLLCEMPSPLQWNAARQWTIDLSFSHPEIHLLRDHVTLLTDVTKDWTSGAPAEYTHWTPMTYLLKLTFRDLHLGLYMNDHNIIDFPLTDDQNTLLVLNSPSLNADARISSIKYQPMHSTVIFGFEAAPLNISRSLPTWNTNAVFGTPTTNSIGQIGSVHVAGNFMYWTDVTNANVDLLKLDINMRSILFKASGSSIRHLIRIRENYFGNFTNFSTRSEYAEKRSRGVVGDPVRLKYRKGRSNMFQVYLCLDIQNCAILLPQELHDLRSAVVVRIPQVQMVLNLHDHFMELTANTHPIRLMALADAARAHKFDDIHHLQSAALRIGGIEISANRLFGPPPQNATYFCVWEISLGILDGSIPNSFINALMSSASAFATSFKDTLNAPADDFRIPLDPDVTFLSMKLESVEVTWSLLKTAIRMSIPSGARFDMNDLPGRQYSTVKSVVVSAVKVQSLLARPLTPLSRFTDEWLEVAAASFDINLDIYGAPRNWKRDAAQKEIFIRSQDFLTQRVPWVYESIGVKSSTATYRRDNALILPCIIVPANQEERDQLEFESDLMGSSRASTSSFSEILTSDGEGENLEERLSFQVDKTKRPEPRSDTLSDEDGDLSSGDESDYNSEGDYTSVLSDSDMEDYLAHSTSEAYKHVLYSYRLIQAQRESGLRFVIEGSKRVDIDLELPEQDNYEQHVPSLSSSLMNNSPDFDAGLTVFRVESRQECKFLLSPLFADSVNLIFDAQKEAQFAPERELDRLFTRFVSTVIDKSPVQTQVLVEARLRHWTVHVFQTVTPDEGIFETSNQLPTLAQQPTAMCHLVMTISQGICQTVITSEGTSKATASFHSASVALRVTPVPTRPSVSAGDLLASHSSIIAQRTNAGNSVTPMIGRITVALPAWSPSIIHQVATSLAATAIPLSVKLAAATQYSRRQRQLLFQGLLLDAFDSVSADPLARTQASFMVNFGKPQLLRSNPTLGMLARMRRFMRQSGHQDVVLAPTDEWLKLSDHEIYSHILDALHSKVQGDIMDFEADEINDSFILRYLFPEETSGNEPVMFLPLVLSLRTDTISVSVANHGEPLNRIELGPAQFKANTAERAFSRLPRANRSSVSLLITENEVPTLHTILTCSLAKIRVQLHPSLLSIIRGLIRLQRRLPQRAPETPKSGNTNASNSRLHLIEGFVDVELLELRAHAQLLTLGLRMKDARLSSSIMLGISTILQTSRQPSPQSAFILAGFRDFSVQARSLEDGAEDASDRAILAAVSLLGGDAFATGATGAVRTTLTLVALKMSFPRSALKLYSFVREWEAEYLPSYDAMLRGIMSEIEVPEPAPPQVRHMGPRKSIRSVDIQAQVNLISISLHVMHGTWLLWSLEDTMAYCTSSDLRSFSYGTQLASQRIMLSARPDGSGALTPASHTSIKLALPSLRLSGVAQESHLKADLVIDSFKLILKPQYFDDILTVQQKFGSDFNDIMDVIAANKPKKRSLKHPSLIVQADVRSEGFVVGVQGPTSTQYLESPMVSARYQTGTTAGTSWHLDVHELALSLVHAQKKAQPVHRSGYRSAYMLVDCTLHNEQVYPSSFDTSLTIDIPRIQALMMPAAIGELGDLIDHVQVEMHQRKNDRATELHAIREKTRRVIETFEDPDSPASPNAPFQNRIISLNIGKIGIAFPLTVQAELTSSIAPVNRSKGSVPAFLVSIESLRFATQRDESGNARMRKFAFQFVSAFDRRISEHFGSDAHGRVNCIMYPEMAADVHSEATSVSRKIMIRANVSGFELDLAPSLPTYIFALIDVYRDGKVQFDRLVSQAGDAEEPNIEKAVRSSSVEEDYSTIPTSAILVSLDFQSGRVKFHLEDPLARISRIIPPPDHNDLSQSVIMESDVFRLPKVSVWLEYHATPAAQKIIPVSGDTQPSRLTFNAVIHSSQNTIRPSLLPFITEVTRQVEARLALASSTKEPFAVHRPSSPASTTSSHTHSSSSLISSMEMIFSLRIDQSNLDFTCMPDVNVNAGLHWKSGGFVLRVSPGGREVGLSGSVDGISTNLRHGYLVDDCVNASARGLSFALSFFPGVDGSGSPVNNISLVVDTQIIGGVRFGRLQDVLCFKAVWLDRIPVFEGAIKPDSPPQGLSLPQTVVPSTDITLVKSFVTNVLVQIESLQFEVDLGQAITKLTLDLRPVVVRTRLTDEFAEISIASHQVKLDAVRAISGRIMIPDLSFETIRRRNANNSSENTLLELVIGTGELSASVNYEGKRILSLRADPLQATVHDAWTGQSANASSSDRQVRLDFSVKGGNVRAGARVMTASELILLGGRVRTLIRAQREGAARESQVFAATRTPEPSNPLSHVASAMLESARSKLKELPSEASLDIRVIQNMQLEVGQIRLGIFNETDTRMTQFEATLVRGELVRNIQAQDVPLPVRDLHLGIASFEVRNGDVPGADKWLEYLSGVKVFTMPEMSIAMHSTEHAQENRLDYRFRSAFPRGTAGKGKGQQTLYIALDFHKYEQLMAMQNAFTEAINKALDEVGGPTRPSPPAISLSVANTSAKAESVLNDLPTGSQPDTSAQQVSPPPPVFVDESKISTVVSVPPDLAAVKVGIQGLTYHCLSRTIETPKLHQLGAASPDLETFKEWTNIRIEDSLPVWIHEYATMPIEHLMMMLLEVYIKQLKQRETGGNESKVAKAK